MLSDGKTDWSWSIRTNLSTLGSKAPLDWNEILDAIQRSLLRRAAGTATSRPFPGAGFWWQ